jgi:hypothetical protein
VPHWLQNTVTSRSTKDLRLGSRTGSKELNQRGPTLPQLVEHAIRKHTNTAASDERDFSKPSYVRSPLVNVAHQFPCSRVAGPAEGIGN